MHRSRLRRPADPWRWAEQKNQTRLIQIIDNMETLKTISFLIVLLALMLGAFHVARLMLAGIHKFSFCLKTHFGSFQTKRLYINGIDFGMVRFSFNDEDKLVIYSKFIGMILLRFEKYIGGYQIYHDHELIVVSNSKRLHNEIMINLSISKR